VSDLKCLNSLSSFHRSKAFLIIIYFFDKKATVFPRPNPPSLLWDCLFHVKGIWSIDSIVLIDTGLFFSSNRVQAFVHECKNKQHPLLSVMVNTVYFDFECWLYPFVFVWRSQSLGCLQRCIFDSLIMGQAASESFGKIRCDHFYLGLKSLIQPLISILKKTHLATCTVPD